MKKICSITGEPYFGYGNNASPFPGMCSDYANDMYVIPARILGITPEVVEECGVEKVKMYIDIKYSRIFGE